MQNGGYDPYPAPSGPSPSTLQTKPVSDASPIRRTSHPAAPPPHLPSSPLPPAAYTAASAHTGHARYTPPVMYTPPAQQAATPPPYPARTDLSSTLYSSAEPYDVYGTQPSVVGPPLPPPAHGVHHSLAPSAVSHAVPVHPLPYSIPPFTASLSPPPSVALTAHTSLPSSAGALHHQYQQHLQPGPPHPPQQYAPEEAPLYPYVDAVYHQPVHAPPNSAYPYLDTAPVAQRPLATNTPATELKLEISAKGLRDRDLISKSDPVAVVFEEVQSYSRRMPAMTSQWRELGRTESIRDELNPHFRQQVIVPYRFEELQKIRIGLWDIDCKSKELSRQDFLGDVETTLGDMVAAGIYTERLRYPSEKDNHKLFGGKRDLGTVTVQVHEEAKKDKISVELSLSGVKLDRKDMWGLGKSDPYVVVSQMKKTVQDQSELRAHLFTSEVIPSSLNPVWNPFRILVDVPSGGTKHDVRLEFHVSDKDTRSRDDEIGSAIVSLDLLERHPNIKLIHSKQKGRGKPRSAGTLVVRRCVSLVMPTLVQYLQGGLRLHFTVAVDLTASNGDPRNPASLHYMDRVTRSNQYVKALTAIANIITAYTPSDNRLAAFGFGADVDHSGTTSHCFPLGLQADPHCAGLSGIFSAYGHALSNVGLSGPTFFAPIIDTVMRMSQQRGHSQDQQNYDVLLILTDGVVSDFVNTVQKIIEASHMAALSIIIIGVGMADFKKMEILDSDNERLRSADGTRQAKRDIVQFVPFRDFENGPPERLAAHVLAELPGNLIEYYTTRQPPILPNLPPT